MGFTPLPAWHILKSVIVINIVKTTFQSMITAILDVNHFISQLSTPMEVEQSSETNWCIRCIAVMTTCTEFDPANKRNQTHKIYSALT
jgi:succinate dehydrogenase/fumarate reductase-like Fe-S protein